LLTKQFNRATFCPSNNSTPTRRQPIREKEKVPNMKHADKLAAIIETINRSGVVLKLAMIIAAALLVAALTPQ